MGKICIQSGSEVAELADAYVDAHIKQNKLKRCRIVYRALRYTSERRGPEYCTLKELIVRTNESLNYEVLVLTDLVNDAPNIDDEFILPSLLRFVLLTDANNEAISENLIASLECISIKSAIEGAIGVDVADLNAARHMPIMLDEYDCSTDAIATMLAKEERTHKNVTIDIAPSFRLSVRFFVLF